MRPEANAPGGDRTITIPVRLDSRTFRRFAIFDAFVVKKHWRGPALFSALLLVFAILALLLRKAQSGLIAAVLLAVGLGLPIIYIGVFLSQVNMQALRNRLTPPRLVYTVTLNGAGISVRNQQKPEETLTRSWQELYRAYRRRKCVYLYAAPDRAFLLPGGQAEVPDAALWDFLAAHLGAGKASSGFGKK